MSKIALLVAVPAALGLVVWNLSLASELDELRDRLAAAEDTEKAVAAAPKDAEPKSREPSARAALQQVSELAARLTDVEKRLPPDPAPTAAGAEAASAAAPAPAAGGDGAYTSEAFKGAVAHVLEEREAARRRERWERTAELRSRVLLRGITVTDQQKADMRKLIVQSLERVDKIRDDESLSDEQRRTDVQAAQQELLDSFGTVLDAASHEAVRQNARPGGRMLRRNNDGGGGGGGAGDSVR